MKETYAYRSEYLVIDCPYCGYQHYVDVADDMGEGAISEEGRKMDCESCGKIMRVYNMRL